jgi:hypothetical protein
MTYRDTASYGKRQEYKAIAKLLHEGFDVYSTLVDDQGIDCVIRINSKRYLEIQIKARSGENCQLKNRGFFPNLFISEDKGDNYFYIFYSEYIDTYWVVPANDIVRMADETGTNVSRIKNKTSFHFAARCAGNNCNPLPQFDSYKNNFNLLKNYEGTE